MPTKICRDCRQEKDVSEFGKNAPSPDGLWIYCKPCARIRNRQTQERSRAKNEGVDPYALVDGQVRTKTCMGCKHTQPVTNFHRSAPEPDGLSYLCKSCMKESRRQLRAKNRAKNLASDTHGAFKRCRDCEQELPTKDFYRDRGTADGLDHTCKRCAQEQARTARERNKANYEPKTAGTKVCGRCKVEKPVTAFTVLRSTKDGLRYACRECESAAYWNLRVEVLTHYCGGNAPSCKCCGQSQLEFLTIEHDNRDGGEHRKEFGSYPIFRWLKKEGYPGGISVLCANCNMSRGHYGYCPCGRAKEQAETQEL